MRRMEADLAREFTAEYRRRGMPAGAAGYHGTRMAQIVVSRMQSGAPEEYWTAGMDGFFKKIAKGFKKAGKFVFKKVIKPIGQWKFLPIAAVLVPGIGMELSASISMMKKLHENKKIAKQAKRAQVQVAYEQQAAVAYRQYQVEALRQNVRAMPFSEFVKAVESHPF